MSRSRTILERFCFSAGAVHAVQAWSEEVLSPLGFTSYEFGRFYDDGTALTFYSSPYLAEFVVQKSLHLVAHVPPSVLSPRFWYLPSQNGSYCRTLQEMKAITGGEGFGNFVVRFPEYFEMHSFLSLLPQENVGTQFVNCKEKLETLCLNFPEKFRALIQDADRERFRVPQEMAPNFKGLKTTSCRTSSIFFDLHFKKIKAELATLVRLKELRLTPRELDCIQGLIQGKTSLEISNELSLSSRTVEHYLDVMKEKLHCSKKSQIISAIIQG